jgi:hypothetical protein
MMRTHGPITLCLALAQLAALPCARAAAQSSAGVPLPGLTSDEETAAAVQSCAVTLSGRDVRVEFDLHTTGNPGALLIEGPSFSSLGDSDAYPDRHFPELEIRIDGASVDPEDRYQVFMGKTDITAAIRLDGMDPWAIARNPPVIAAKPEARSWKALEKMHAVQPSGEDYLANWTARRLLRIPLHTSANQRIELRYRARPAFMHLASDQLLAGGREAAYCLSPKQLNTLLHAAGNPRPLELVEYSFASGIDGHPAATATLAATAQAGPAEKRVFHFACGPRSKPIAVAGNLKRQPVQTDPSGNVRLLEVMEP